MQFFFYIIKENKQRHHNEKIVKLLLQYKNISAAGNIVTLKQLKQKVKLNGN